MNGETSLYRHYDAAGNLLYVGISLNAIDRLKAHNGSDWRDQISRIEIERFPTRADAARAECEAIQNERPKHNVVYNGPMSAIGSRIRSLRIARDMTQGDLASLCGITKAAVSRWECGGTANMKLPNILVVMNTFGVTLDELLRADA